MYILVDIRTVLYYKMSGDILFPLPHFSQIMFTKKNRGVSKDVIVWWSKGIKVSVYVLSFHKG
jgi:hypothetical protein